MLQCEESSQNECTCVADTQMKKEYSQHPHMPVCPFQELRNPEKTALLTSNAVGQFNLFYNFIIQYCTGLSIACLSLSHKEALSPE